MNASVFFERLLTILEEVDKPELISQVKTLVSSGIVDMNDDISVENALKLLSGEISQPEIIDVDSGLYKQLVKKPDHFNMNVSELQELAFDVRSSIMDSEIVAATIDAVPINVKASIFTLSEDMEFEGLRFSSKLNSFDREVANALDTLWLNKVQVFTDNQVYSVMTGKHTSSQKILNDIRNSIRKLRLTLAKVDCTELAKKTDNNIEFMAYDDNLYHIESISVNASGRITDGYRFKDMQSCPILLDYSKRLSMVYAVNSSLLDVPAISSTKAAITIKAYILRKMHKMLYGGSDNFISYQDMFEYCQCDNTGTAGNRNKDMVIRFLDFYCETGVLLSYEEILEKRVRVGVLLNINPEYIG